jgi:hypothetical protein
VGIGVYSYFYLPKFYFLLLKLSSSWLSDSMLQLLEFIIS